MPAPEELGSIVGGVEHFKELTYTLTHWESDFTLNKNHLDRRCPLDYGRHIATNVSSLGSLQKLPMEMLVAVLVQFDMETLTAFRQVSQSAMRVVNSIPQYCIVAVSAPDLIRAVLSLKTGRYISCQLLYDTLCTNECDTCRKIGGYVYLVTCKRVCLLCFTENKAYLPLLRSHVVQRFAPDKTKFKNIPQFKCPPGIYSENMNSCWNRTLLFDHELAKRAGIESHGSETRMLHRVSIELQRRYDNFNARSVIRLPGQRRPNRPEANWDNEYRTDNPKRYMAVVRVGWFDQRSMLMVEGAHCLGCSYKWGLPDPALNCKHLYSVETLEEHLQYCRMIGDPDHQRYCERQSNGSSGSG